MSVIGDFTVSASAFSLEEALTEVPAMTVEAERLATHSTMEVMPYLWAFGGDFEAFTDALQSDPSVETVTIAEETDEAVLYKIRWSDEIADLIDSMVDHHAAIVEARGQSGEWRFKLRFAGEEQVGSFREHFDERDRYFEVNRLYHPDGVPQREYDMTEEQYDTLVAAFDAGYFEVPRTTTVDELAEQFDVSANAVSQRIRRATSNLVGNGLRIVGDDDGE